jgi:nucleoside-diphosphate-sugar epimerase
MHNYHTRSSGRERLREAQKRMHRIVITGTSGFIGSRLKRMFQEHGHEVVPVPRELLFAKQEAEDARALEALMRDAAAVIHLAARAHVIVERQNDPLGEFRKANLAGTVVTCEAAMRAGVPRFVYVSSIGVLGASSGDRVFRESDPPSPVEPYAISKWEAEQALHEMEASSPSTQIVVVRPPLVYGPGVKGNFLRLLRLVHSGVPLPLGNVKNRRSYVGLHNLCEFLMLCSHHPQAKGLFLVSDGEDVSTPDLLNMITDAMAKRSRVFDFPRLPLRVLATALGKRAELERLTGDLRVDSSFARSKLGWNPTMSLRAGVAEMVDWFLGEVNR